jgi:glycine cleavage system H lipoate-binding protein
MSCPFLKEGRGRYCHAAPVRKMILDGPGASDGGRCSSADYRLCELVPKEDWGRRGCPHLEEVHLQYCAAAPVIKMVPFSEMQHSPCTSSGYRYCETYLILARPNQPTPPPPDLLYAPNHLWLQVEERGRCHVGIDIFFAHTLGTVDQVTYVTTHGTHRPAVTLTVHGVEWPIVFPNPLLIERVNTHLRGDPSRLATDPYGVGWLFQGWELPGRTRAGLVGDGQAAAWQAEERERLAERIQQVQGVACDGGDAQRGVIRMLPRQDMVALLQRFFSKRDWAPEE